VEVVIKSEAVIVSNTTLSKEKKALLEGLLYRMHTVQQSNGNKYILLNAPNEKLEEIIEILPGMKSPTVLPLYEKGWSSIHSVVHEKEFWTIHEKLKNLGAEGILVIPIEKMIM
jgi:ATP phosphoribosyltransferase